VQWKRFMAESSTWEREEDLGYIREAIEEFERRISTKLRRQEKLDMMEKKDFRRGELLEKYIAKMLYRWDNGKFEKEYLKKLERNWQKWKTVSPEEKP